jgi:ABC-2 type transport system permease protein
MMAVYKREMRSYFSTPLAYIFVSVFLVLSGIMTFYPGGFFERGQADLRPFFNFHPWLYLFLAPALGMKLWAEERKTGTFELLLTLPVSIAEAVMGKFLAAWTMLAISLALTLPTWITVNVLGDPDNLVIAGGYLGSLLLAGAFLAISACISAATRNQVIAFVVSIAVSFAFLLMGFPLISDIFRAWLPAAAFDFIASLGFVFHFEPFLRGVIDLRDIIFFVLFIAVWLHANATLVHHHRS